jgi:hypothetical protein
MAAPFAAGFTTVDLTPPAVIDLSPGIDGNGIALSAVVRVKYSEPIDPATFLGPAVKLTKGTATVTGRIDFLFGNTTMVFTPAQQLDENTVYQVQLGAALDLAGNAQPQAPSFSFRTLDRTPPSILSLAAAGDGTVIENGTTKVVADVGTAHDVSVVDFFINDQPASAARTAPFTLSLQAIAAFGKPGDQIKVSALATDTSGNRSVTSSSPCASPTISAAHRWASGRRPVSRRTSPRRRLRRRAWTSSARSRSTSRPMPCRVRRSRSRRPPSTRKGRLPTPRRSPSWCSTRRRPS